MKRLLLWLIVFAAVSGGLLHAQDIAGTWQGTLTAPGGGPALRIVVEVSKADDQSLKVVFAASIRAVSRSMQGRSRFRARRSSSRYQRSAVTTKDE